MDTAQIKTLPVGASFKATFGGAAPIPLTVSNLTSGDKFVGVDASGQTYTWLLTGLKQIPEIGL